MTDDQIFRLETSWILQESIEDQDERTPWYRTLMSIYMLPETLEPVVI